MIFGGNRKNEQTGKSGHMAPTPQRGRGAQKGTPQVSHGVALLRRKVAVLRRGVDTIHSEEIFGFCSKSLIFIH